MNDGKQKKKPPVMAFRQSLFWDVNPKTINPEKHAVYIIERILDFGNDEEVRWMWKFYDHNLIRKTADTSRVIHPQSRSFWKLMLSI